MRKGYITISKQPQIINPRLPDQLQVMRFTQFTGFLIFYFLFSQVFGKEPVQSFEGNLFINIVQVAMGRARHYNQFLRLLRTLVNVFGMITGMGLVAGDPLELMARGWNARPL